MRNIFYQLLTFAAGATKTPPGGVTGTAQRSSLAARNSSHRKASPVSFSKNIHIIHYKSEEQICLGAPHYHFNFFTYVMECYIEINLLDTAHFTQQKPFEAKRGGGGCQRTLIWKEKVYWIQITKGGNTKQLIRALSISEWVLFRYGKCVANRSY